MFIELHVLQNFAPSNLNRDDTGNPKDTEFGGVRRARISSQCIKRAIRENPVFTQTTGIESSTRSRWTTRLLADRLVAAGKPEEAAWEVATALLTILGFKLEKDKQTQKMRSSVLLFLSIDETKIISSQLLKHWDTLQQEGVNEKNPTLQQIAKDWAKELAKRPTAPDIALFGRMMAERPALNLDAAAQVAHAISTHRVNMDMDFFTAVDDLSTDEETGAGMMGVTPFNSATYYRYARIDWGLLVKNLQQDVPLAGKTIEGFLLAATTAIPSGKQTGFAAQNQPDFILAVIRKDGQSWSLANAFEKPVHAPREGGYLSPSIDALDAYWGDLTRVYGKDGVHCFVLATKKNTPLENLEKAVAPNREAWLKAIIDLLPKG